MFSLNAYFAKVISEMNKNIKGGLFFPIVLPSYINLPVNIKTICKVILGNNVNEKPDLH